MDLLHNPVRPYAWGSRTVLADLLGRPSPAPHPEAELWMGAHPSDPSGLDGECSLLDAINADPAGQLGPETATRWDNRLPFFLKILAAEEPLSMQAHPSVEQAAAGYAAEESAGVPREAPERNYPDPTAKPEMVCALSTFEVLAGFAPTDESLALLHALETPELAPYTKLLDAEPNADGLRALFTTWITLPQERLDDVLPGVLKACQVQVDADTEHAWHCRTVLELAQTHPHDPAVLAAALLNRVSLSAGEAVFLPAGNLHLYLRGTALEVLANSDNVLRGGLTPKHVDVPELLRVVDFEPAPMPVFTGEIVGGAPCMRLYDPGVDEFKLHRVQFGADDSTPVSFDGGRPQLLVCTAGSATLTSDDASEAVELSRGDSAWLPATHPAVTVHGNGETLLFHATPGR